MILNQFDGVASTLYPVDEHILLVSQGFSGRAAKWLKRAIFLARGVLRAASIYSNNLKNLFLVASVFPQNSCSHSRLASRQ